MTTKKAKAPAPAPAPANVLQRPKVFDAARYELERSHALIKFWQAANLIAALYSTDALRDEVIKMTTDLRGLVRQQEKRRELYNECGDMLPELDEHADLFYCGHLAKDWHCEFPQTRERA